MRDDCPDSEFRIVVKYQGPMFGRDELAKPKLPWLGAALADNDARPLEGFGRVSGSGGTILARHMLVAIEDNGDKWRMQFSLDRFWAYREQMEAGGKLLMMDSRHVVYDAFRAGSRGRLDYGDVVSYNISKDLGVVLSSAKGRVVTPGGVEPE